MDKIAGIGKSYRRKLARVLEVHSAILTSEKVASVLEVPKQEASRLLARWEHRGWIQRIHRGSYVPIALSSTNSKPAIENPAVVAESLYGPGYVGGFSAVKHWDLSEQIFEDFTYFTTKHVKNRAPLHGDIRYRLKTVVPNRVFGVEPVWFGTTKTHVSDPTKTLIDLFDDPSLAGGMSVVRDIFDEYLSSEYFDFDLLLSYAIRNNNRAVQKRIGFLLESSFDPIDTQLEGCLLYTSPSPRDS